MKYIKKYNEELDVKKALLGGALAATMIGTSCKKDDIVPIQPEKIEVDSNKVDDKVDDVTDSENKKSNLYNCNVKHLNFNNIPNQRNFYLSLVLALL